MIPSLNKWDIWLAKVAFEDESNIIKNIPVLIIDNTNYYCQGIALYFD